MAILPLWKDISLQSQPSSLIYKVYDSANNVIYEGYTIERETDYGVEVRLNDIFADNLGERIIMFPPSSTLIDEDGKGYRKYRVELSSQGINKVYEVVADYSYQKMPVIPSAPIRLLLDRRQHFFVTNWDSSTDINIHGVTATGTVRINSFYGPKTCGIPLPLLSTYIGFQVQKTGAATLKYKMIDTCADYVLHYINAFGGWDSLVMLGRCAVKEGYTRHSIGKPFIATESTSINNGNVIGTAIVANEVAKKWTLRTGLLTDDESSRMYHLLGTTRAILEDLNTGEVYPVIITNSSYEEQTFRGNGNRMAQYEINVELAQQRVRR